MSELRNGADSRRGKRVEDPRRDLDPNVVPDAQALERAVESGDYAAFRRVAMMYEGWLNDRVGRWVQRYPELEAKIGDELVIADLVENVFLNAFERYRDKPGPMRLRDWLEEMIDPSVRLMLNRRDQELENISYARSTLGASPQEG